MRTLQTLQHSLSQTLISLVFFERNYTMRTRLIPPQWVKIWFKYGNNFSDIVELIYNIIIAYNYSVVVLKLQAYIYTLWVSA